MIKDSLVQIITTIALSLVILCISIELTVSFKPLFYYDINALHIEQDASMNRGDIVKNYDYLINFVYSRDKVNFKLPTLPSSVDASEHFYQVKNLFIEMSYILVGGIIILVLGVIYSIRKKQFKFLNWGPILLTSFIVIMGIFFTTNFDETFTIFHKLFFRNSLWLFDPNTDPVITMLPETFFLHCGIMILAIILISSCLLILLGKKLKKYKS
ncbi:MAG TPA: TIGR01906 family membrane protein [Clostridiaceae bacterium]